MAKEIADLRVHTMLAQAYAYAALENALTAEQKIDCGITRWWSQSIYNENIFTSLFGSADVKHLTFRGPLRCKSTVNIRVLAYHPHGEHWKVDTVVMHMWNETQTEDKAVEWRFTAKQLEESLA